MKNTKKTTRGRSGAFLLSVLVLITGFAIFYYYSTNEPYNLVSPSENSNISKSPKLQNTNEERSTTNESNSTDSPEINMVIMAKTGSTANLSLYNFTEGKPVLFFTDSDEKYKVKEIIGKNINGEIIVTVEESDQSPAPLQLAKISTDGKAKIEIIQKSFGSDITPAISPDGQKIAYVVFSNAEQDFGFSLFLSNLAGDNRVLMDKNPLGFLDIDFTPDNKFLLAIRKNADGKKELVSYQLSAEKSDIIYQGKQNIKFVSAYNDGIALAESKRIILLGRKQKSFPTHSEVLALSASGDFVIYLTNEQKENIYLYNTKTQTTKSYSANANDLIVK